MRIRAVEEILRQAVESGQFDNLPGKGKPLKLDENPYVGPEWRLAYDMLKQRGFAPEWIEARQAIERDLGAARETLARSAKWRKRALAEGQPEALVESEWRRAQAAFEEKLDDINQRIADYNLMIPSEKFYRMRVDVKREIKAVS